jgi:hypothetical protein
MPNDNPARVHYFDRQYLRIQDFTDEQAYHLTMRWRHNIAHHTWGIVHGLELVEEEGSLFVQPGMAVDGYGRELILPDKRPLSTGAFDDKASDVLDVWLVYDRVGSDQAPPGYAGCGDSVDAAFYRWLERPQIRLQVPKPVPTNRRQPEEVPEGDWVFDPSRTASDDPQAYWPVFLGQIARTRAKPEQPYTYTTNRADRPYVGLVGWAVEDPAGRARVEIGAEQPTARRFAVFIPEADPSPNAAPRLEINNTGAMEVRGNTTLHGDLTVAGGAIEFGVGDCPDTPQPWRIYHCKQTSRQGGTDVELDELRIEMASTPAGQNRVVIGSWNTQEKKFHPCLTIVDDCSVTVHGDLIVEGRLIENTPRAEAMLSTEAQASTLGAFVSGVSGANLALLEPAYSLFRTQTLLAAAAITSAPETSINALEQLLANATFVANNRDRLVQLAESLQRHLGG